MGEVNEGTAAIRSWEIRIIMGMSHFVVISLSLFAGHLWGLPNHSAIGMYTSSIYPDSVLVLVSRTAPGSHEPIAIHGCYLPLTILDELQPKGIFVYKTRTSQWHFDPFVS